MNHTVLRPCWVVMYRPEPLALCKFLAFLDDLCCVHPQGSLRRFEVSKRRRTSPRVLGFSQKNSPQS
jgi:hypothetical protein